MKSIFNFFQGQKKEYIGLTSFKKEEPKKTEIKEIKISEKSSLTGLLKRVG